MYLLKSSKLRNGSPLTSSAVPKDGNIVNKMSFKKTILNIM